MKGIKKIV